MAIKYSVSMMSSRPGTVAGEITERKAYARAQSEKMTFAEFCEHVDSHGGVTQGETSKVLYDVVKCLKHCLLDGKSVEIEGLGTFYVSIKSKGARNAAEFTAENITYVGMRLVTLKDWKNLRNKARFEFVPTRDAMEELKAKQRAQSSQGSGSGGGLETE